MKNVKTNDGSIRPLSDSHMGRAKHVLRLHPTKPGAKAKDNPEEVLKKHNYEANKITEVIMVAQLLNPETYLETCSNK